MDNNYIRKTIYINDKEISFFLDKDNKDIFMSKSEMAYLYDASIANIGMFIKRKIISENNPTSNNLFIVQVNIETLKKEGDKLVKRKIKHYNLKIIKEIGYKLNPNLLNELLDEINKLFNNNSNYGIIENSLNKAINYEIVKYYDGNFSLDVSISPSEETVWLNQNEIAYLFSTNKQSISYHINNIFKDKELEMNQVVKEILTTGNDGKLYNVLYYNLDMIISIGYRVNSKRGIAFRRWAANILKDYLLKGYAYDEKRCLECNSSIVLLHNEVNILKDVSINDLIN